MRWYPALLVFLFFPPARFLSAAQTADQAEAKGEVAAAPRSDARKDRLAERDRLAYEGLELREQGKLEEALVRFQQVLTIETELFGPVHDETAGTWDIIAQTRELAQEWPTAADARKRVLDIKTKLHGEEHYQTMDARRAVAHLQQKRQFSSDELEELVKADRQGQEVVRLHGQGKFAEAVKMSELVVETHHRLLGQAHPSHAASLNNLAGLYYSMGDYAKAEKRYRQSLEIREKVLGEAHPDYAASLNDLAVLYESAGNYAKAEPLYQRSMEIRRRVLGEAHRDYAQSLNNLAGLFESLGDYVKAEPLYWQSMEVRKQVLGEAHPDYAQSLNNLAGFYISMGDYVKAEPLYWQSMEVRKQVLGEAHPDYSQSLNNLAVLYISMGDYAKAEPLCRQSLEIDRMALGEAHPSYATSLNNLGWLYSSMGNYAKAEPLYRQSLEIRKKVLGEAHPAYTTSLNNLAGLYDSMGDYAKAEPLYRQSLEIRKKVLGEAHPAYATSLNNLAALYEAMGNYARAEPLYQQSKEIRKKILGEAHPNYAASLSNLAGLYKSMGDYAKAKPLQQQSMETLKEVLGEAHPDYATSLNNLASLHHSMGDNATAETLFRKGMEIQGKVLGEAHPEYARSLNNLAMLYRSNGNDAKAEPLFRQALAIRNQQFEAASVVQSERQQRQMGQSNLYTLEGYISAAAEARRLNAAVYADVLRWKGNTTLRQRLLRVAATTPDAQKLFDDLKRSAAALTMHLQRVPEPKQRDIWQRQLAELSESKERSERQLSNQSTSFRQARKLIKLEELAAALPKDSALVDFLEYRHSATSKSQKGKWDAERRLLAMVVRPDGSVRPVEFEPPLAVEELTKLVGDWRAEFEQKESTRAGDGDDPAARLRTRLWEPIEKRLAGVKTVLLSPDGVLCRLPLAALPGATPGSFLLEEYSFAVIPVPQMLPLLVEKSAEADNTRSDANVSGRNAGAKPGPNPGGTSARALLVVGDVDYDAGGTIAPKLKRPFDQSTHGPPEHTGRWNALPATRAEIATIARTFGNVFDGSSVTRFDGAAATESAFRELAPRHYYLHVATHGFFAPERFRSIFGTSGTNEDKSSPAARSSRAAEFVSPFGAERPFDVNMFHPGLLSGLALAGANRPPEEGYDDGILTAEEVATMNLDGVHLVTLSACETGLGEVAGGEGLLGLQRAFQISGARTVIASMWRVPDEATRFLMERFYRNLWDRRMTRLDALREAQLWVLHGRPELANALVERGEIRKRVLRSAPADQKAKAPLATTNRLPPYYWAGFVLSGDWR